MTPGARASAAIEILDQVLAGAPAEKALTNWARQARYAGSGDRAAIRDIVFGCLRCRESYFAQAGMRSGRGLVLAHVGAEAGEIFTGEGYAPDPLSADERGAMSGEADRSAEAQYDLPGWLIERLQASLGDQALTVAQCLRARAPVMLRVALRRMSREAAQEMLAEDGIGTLLVDGVSTALQVVENPRKVVVSRAYRDGVVELQDASSQAMCLGLPEAEKMLDYCAGGGGKVLAYADRGRAKLFAHDASAARMKDLPKRAARAGVRVSVLDQTGCTEHAPYDLVLVDAPCSGSGTWRRTPEEKWRLSAARLDELIELQAEILDRAAELVAPGGCLAYATCSIFREENSVQIERFVARSSRYSLSHMQQILPSETGDGFFVAHLTDISAPA